MCEKIKFDQLWLYLPHITKGIGIGILFILQKWLRVYFSPNKREVGNIVEEG